MPLDLRGYPRPTSTGLELEASFGSLRSTATVLKVAVSAITPVRAGISN